MKFSVEQILSLPGIKVLSCQDIQGFGLIIETQSDSNRTYASGTGDR